ncbi:MAG TPA: GMC family oxidoreductase [Pyrinomonadaceae bacterium]|nr:GMC family oxidoreductase [Pyrinomonadaceae bacterium]
MQKHQVTDACVIGLGASGGIIAAELAKAGLSVVGLEAGAHYKREVFEDHSEVHDELTYVRHGKLRWNQPEVLVYNDGPPLTFPLIARNIGVGGPLHWSCFAYRFHESDFHVQTRSGVPQGSNVANWPLSYADLEPYYDHAEYEFGVAGVAGANPFEARRQRPYPLPPLTRQRAGQVFTETATRLGYHPFSIPAAITTQPGYGGKSYRQPCNYCGYCTFYGCEQHAKGATLVVTLPEALTTGQLDIRSRCLAAEITVDSAGQAQSVNYLDSDGKKHEQPARIIVVCNNAAYVVRLLLLSRSMRFPNGLANNSGLVGKNLMFHASVFGYGTFDERELDAIQGPQATVAFDDLNEDRPRQQHDQSFVRGAAISGGLPLPFTGGPLAFASALGTFMPLPAGVPSWGKGFKDFLARYYKRHFAVSALCEDLPVESNRIELDSTVKDNSGLPALKIIYADHSNTVAMQKFMRAKIEELLKAAGARHVVVTIPMIPGGAAAGHVMGTTRMGNDPKVSVVNQYCQSHEVPNLFIGGSSVFVTSSGVNPTLTIFALAYRTAEHIIKLWKEGAFT